MKKYLLGLFVVLAFALSSCNQQPTYVPVQQQAIDPDAQYGTYNGQQVVYVTDNRGERFLMDLILFNNLMGSGGYNSVTSYYYGHASDYGHIYPYSSSGFHYTSRYSGFNSSYRTVYASHRVYTPSASVINSSTSVRTSHYGNAYRPTTRVTTNATTYHPSGAVTKSTYKTTYHANGRVSQSAQHTTYHPSGHVSYHSSYHSSGRRR